MRITDNLCEAVGRITADQAMCALFLQDREHALSELKIELTAGEIEILDRYMEMLSTGSPRIQNVLSTVLRSSDRTVQR